MEFPRKEIGNDSTFVKIPNKEDSDRLGVKLGELRREQLRVLWRERRRERREQREQLCERPKQLYEQLCEQLCEPLCKQLCEQLRELLSEQVLELLNHFQSVNLELSDIVSKIFKHLGMKRDSNCLDRNMPGFRFQPSDGEIVGFYLKKKVKNETLPTNGLLHDVNLYEYDPDTLAENFMANHKATGSKEWYFFTQRDKKYKNGDRPNRVANGGFWKATGPEKHITYKGNLVGSKKSLAFYWGKPSKREKTSWLMDEFTLKNAPRSGSDSNNMKLDDWVLSRIRKKESKSDDKDQNQQTRNTVQYGQWAAQRVQFADSTTVRGECSVPVYESVATDSVEDFNQDNINSSHCHLPNGFAEVHKRRSLPQDRHQPMMVGGFNYSNLEESKSRDISSQLLDDKYQNQKTKTTVQSGQWPTQLFQFGDSTTVPGECSVPVNERVATAMNTDLIGNVGSMGDFNQHNIYSSHCNSPNGFADVHQGCIQLQDRHQTMMADGFNYSNLSREVNRYTWDCMPSGETEELEHPELESSKFLLDVEPNVPNDSVMK